MLKIVEDTYSPRLKVIEKELGKYSIQAIKDAHMVYKKIQYPLVPISDTDKDTGTGHAGRLLSSMDIVHYFLSFGKSVTLEFGFFAHGENGDYALLQEENPYNWEKHERYSGHNPIDGYFKTGLAESEKPMFNTIHKKLGELLK